MSSSFSDTSIGVSQEAHLESAFIHKGWKGDIYFTFKWELRLERKMGDAHWVRQELTISREQAEFMHKALGHMLSDDMTDINDDLRWFVSDGEVTAESEPVG